MAQDKVTTPTHTIFYSWQSDSPNSINRGFIADCLEKAISQIKSEEPYKLVPCIDRDTLNVPGSPSITETIFSKIEAADVFVADVSFIAKAEKRLSPNPNVMIELGYAANCLGWNAVLCILNESSGKIEELPFDIKHRSMGTYTLAEGQDKSDARKHLVSWLKTKLTQILKVRTNGDEVFDESIISEIKALSMHIVFVVTEKKPQDYYRMLKTEKTLHHKFSFNSSHFINHLFGLLKDGISKVDFKREIFEYLKRNIPHSPKPLHRSGFRILDEEFERLLALLQKRGVVEGSAEKFALTDLAKQWYLTVLLTPDGIRKL